MVGYSHFDRRPSPASRKRVATALSDDPLEHFKIDVPAADDGDHFFSLEALGLFEEAADGDA